jgi:type IX secretion system PorP/SprF family membrane protein
MKGSIFYLSLLLLLATLSAQAQQDPLYGLYLNNPLVINPAYTGLSNNLAVNVSYRRQWASFDGAPNALNANGAISLLHNKIGAGLQIVQDNIGENKITAVSGLFAYKLNLDRKVVSFGMSAGLTNYAVSPGKLNLQDPTDPYFPTVSEMAPTLGVGVMLKTDRYLLGVSVPRLIAATVQAGGQDFKVYQQHYYLFASYLFFVSEKVVFKPATLLKATNGNPLSVDVNLNLILNRNYLVGAYTRNLNTFGLLAQMKFLDKFKLAYSFEVPTGASVGTQFVTNEVLIRIRTAVFTSHTSVDDQF